MLLSDEQKTGLTPEQISEIETAYSAKETELRALANKNADAIFNGAAQKLAEQTGIQKNEGEKFSDYAIRLGSEWLPEQAKKKLTEAEQKAKEWEEKFKNHKGDDTFKTELEKAQSELAKIPDLLKAKELDFETKYKALETIHETFKFSKSINDAMPKFDDNVNQFEVKAKKQNAIDRIKKEYKLSYDKDDNLVGTKDYKDFLVSDLLKADEELKDLILIDQETGGGGTGDHKKQTKGLMIPAGMGKGAAQQLIEEYLVTVEKLDKLDSKYSDRFKELCKESNVL